MLEVVIGIVEVSVHVDKLEVIIVHGKVVQETVDVAIVYLHQSAESSYGC